LAFRNIRSLELLKKIQDRLAVSAGYACHADVIKMSGVLEAVDVTLEYGMGAVRFPVGKAASEQDVWLQK